MSLNLDFSLSLRTLRKNPGFVSLCVLVIGLGMGLSITMYSIISNFYEDLPFPDGDRIVAVRRVVSNPEEDIRGELFDAYTYRYLKGASTGYDTFGAYREDNVTFSDGEVAQQFIGAYLSPELLQITAVAPISGRSLLPGDNVSGAAPVALISYHLWQNYYAGREDIVGTTARINGEPHTIIGVMPEAFNYPNSSELWLPLQLPANALPGEAPYVMATARLKEEVDRASANAEVGSLLAQLSDEYPELYSDQGAEVTPFTSGVSGIMVFWHILSVLTACLLLLVCLNISNLLAVRTNERLPELAIRNALGAGPWRLVQSVLLDSLVICVAGAVLGILLADLGMAFFRTLFLSLFSGVTSASQLPFYFTFDWDADTLLVSLLALLLIWLFSGGMAAWKVIRRDIHTVLGSTGTGTVNMGGKAGSVVLVSFEIIFSSFLLILCGVFIGYAIDMTRLDFGTASEGYLTGRISLPEVTYPANIDQENYRRNLRQALLAQEGIAAVSFTSDLPGQLESTLTSYSLPDRDLAVDGRYPIQEMVQIAPDYFDMMDVSLIEGRQFEATDREDTLPVVIIDDIFASQMWPDQSPLGKQLQINPEQESAELLTVVGVIPHIIQRVPLAGLNEPNLYRPFSQGANGSFSVVLKVRDNPDNYRQVLQQAAGEVDRDIPVTRIMALSDALEFSQAFSSFISPVVSSFAIFTLVLAVTGIYAIVARSVWQRTREIGIRRALGSSNVQVQWVFVRQGFGYLGLGLLFGGTGAVLAVYALSKLFTDVLIWLPWVLTGVAGLLAVLIFFATWYPASRLVSREPGDTLRYE